MIMKNEWWIIHLRSGGTWNWLQDLGFVAGIVAVGVYLWTLPPGLQDGIVIRDGKKYWCAHYVDRGEPGDDCWTRDEIARGRSDKGAVKSAIWV
jgi:hypothetical protein